MVKSKGFVMAKRRGRMTREQYAIARAGVMPTAEFWRVWNLPRRQIVPPGVDGRAPSVDIAAWTNALRTPHGKKSLLFDQALALAEFAQVGGAIILLEAGSGKSLIAFLIPSICQAERPVVFCPANTVKTLNKQLDLWRNHFVISDRLQIKSYHELSAKHGRDMLDSGQFDCMILDEAHMMKSEDAARTMRFYDYVNDKEKQGKFVRVIPMTGTWTVRNLRECGPLFNLALRTKAPVPRARDELEMWGDALGSDVTDDTRVWPGALSLFGSEYGFLTEKERSEYASDALELARRGFGRRVAETPGVINSSEEALKTPITIRFPTIKIPSMIMDAFSILRQGQTPGDEDVADAADISATARQLICGFYYRWVWPGGVKNQMWLDARSAWYRYMRKIIYEHKDLKLDTNGLVENACRAHEFYTYAKAHPAQIPAEVKGRLAGMTRLDSPAYRAWTAVRDQYTPVKETVWIDDYLVEETCRWLSENKGVAWVEHIAFGEAIRARGFPYYGGGMNEVETAQESCAASIFAHYQGKNMQQFHRALYILPPAQGSVWEQSLARFHRIGQEADHIYADVFAFCWETYRSMLQALADAKYASAIAPKPQRLMRASIVGMPTFEQIGKYAEEKDPLWLGA